MIFHLSRKNFVDTEVRVVVDHLACGLVLDHAIERGFVILALLGDLVSSSRCTGVLFSRGNARYAHQRAGFVEIGFLLAAVDLDERSAGDAIAIPVGNVVRYGWCRVLRVAGSGAADRAANSSHVVGTRRRHIETGGKRQGNAQQNEIFHVYEVILALFRLEIKAEDRCIAGSRVIG